MYFRFLCCTLMLIASGFADAQAQHKITGKINDKSGKEVIHAVIVVENAKDSTIIGSAYSNEKGLYELDRPGTDSVMIKAEAIGYAAQLKNIAAGDLNPVLNFSLVPNKALTEVTVSARKPLIEQKPDRTIFNVENSIAAIGGDALEALKKTPGVQVINNQVTMAGKGSVSIMIDGRMQQVSGDDLTQLLRTIPSDNLSKIEVITTPPAKYDAEGNSGIINLVTKKSKLQGLRGSATAGYNQNTYGSPNLSTSMNYRKDKLNVFCNANTGIWAWKYTNHNTTYYPNEVWQQDIWQRSYNTFGKIQAGVDYTLNKTMLLGVSYTQAYSNIVNNEHILSRSADLNNNTDSMMRTTGLEHERNGDKRTANINYEWKIDTNGRKLNVDADYFSQIIHKDRDLNMVNYLADGTYTPYGGDSRVTGSPSVNIRSVKADLEWPAKFVNLSLGCKASFVNNKADNIYEKLQGSTYILDTAQTNVFEYKEQIQAAYISAQKKTGKFEIQAGLRGEHTHTTGYSPTTGQTNENDYTKFFPSGYIQYRYNDDHVFNVSYSRRINRPGYGALNPFRYYITSVMYLEGNPNLQPAYNNIAELSYTYKSRYTFKVFGRQTENYFDRFAVVDTLAGTTNFTRANIGSAKYAGATINIFLTPAKWWEFRGDFNWQYTYYKLHYQDNATFTGNNGWVEIDNSFFLNKKHTLSAELSAYYYTPKQKDYKYWDVMSCINMGVKAMFLNKNLVVALNIDDLMAKTYWLQTNLENGTKEYSYDDERAVRISLTYKFGNKNVKAKRDRNTTTEEMQRID